MNSFLFFMIDEEHRTHDAEVTKNTRTISWSDGAMEMKRKLYLRIILLSNYMMEENLFVYIECSSVKHVASRFSVRKNVTKKKNKKEKKRKKESDTWMD